MSRLDQHAMALVDAASLEPCASPLALGLAYLSPDRVCLPSFGFLVSKCVRMTLKQNFRR